MQKISQIITYRNILLHRKINLWMTHSKTPISPFLTVPLPEDLPVRSIEPYFVPSCHPANLHNQEQNLIHKSRLYGPKTCNLGLHLFQAQTISLSTLTHKKRTFARVSSCIFECRNDIPRESSPDVSIRGFIRWNGCA